MLTKGEETDDVIIIIIFVILVIFIGAAIYSGFQPKDKTEMNESNKTVEQLKKTTTGDFLIFENGRVGLVQLSGGIEEGSFSFIDLEHSRPTNRFGIGDWKGDIKEVVLQSDTLRWYEIAREHLIP